MIDMMSVLIGGELGLMLMSSFLQLLDGAVDV